MSDGAHLGVGAERALATVLGGEPQPTDEELQTAEEMRAEILATTENPHTYGGTATYAANRIFHWLTTDTSRALLPVENVYEETEDGRLVVNDEGGLNLIEHGWYDRMKEDGFMPADGMDLTGFMWGWAVNAARRCLELPPVANPAIVDI